MAERPTKEQVEAEAKALTELKPKVRHYSMFGDDNRAKVQAQIDVLVSDLSEDEIYDMFDSRPEMLDSALDARHWLDGELEMIDIDDDGLLSTGWKDLVVE